MSYYPPGGSGPGPEYGQGQGGGRPNGGYPPGPGGPAPMRVQRPGPARSSGGGFGCGSFILGFLTAAVLAGVGVFFLYFYNPNANSPLPRPTNAPGTPDISATLSQEYLNNEISRTLTSNPFKVSGITLQDAVITVKENSQIDVAMRATGVVSFDLTATEQVTVENGQIKLTLVGQPRMTNGQLPPAAGDILQQINTGFIEPHINEQVTQIMVDGRKLTLTGITTTSGLLTVQAKVQ